MTGDKYVDVNTQIEPEPIPIELLPAEPVTRRSPTFGKLVEALAKAQLEFEPIRKDQNNPYYNSKYADLSNVIAATQTALAKNGLVVMQEPCVDVARQRVTVTTTLAHSSGEWKEHELTLPAVMIGKDGRVRFDAQSCGAAITYGRRYSYQGAVGVAAELDDDGNGALGKGSKEAATAVGEQKVKDLEAAKRAKQQGNGADLTKPLADSIAAVQTAKPAGNGHSKPSIEEMLQAAKEADLFEELSGTLLDVKDMKTSAAQGGRPFKRLAIATDAWGEIKDIEVSSFDNITMSDCKAWDVLIPFYVNSPITLLVEKRESKGKTYYNLRDLKKLGQREWDARLAVIHNEGR